jgi:hypothetical protein
MIKAEILLATPRMNHMCEKGFTYKNVGTMEGENLENLFFKCQNGIHNPNQDYSKLEARSLSVGDILRIDGEHEMLKNFGFRTVDSDYFTELS